MNYAHHKESYNTVNLAALEIIPHIDQSYFEKLSNPKLEKLMMKLEEKIKDFKDVTSIYENSKFSTHLRAKELMIEIEQIKSLIENMQ